MQKERAELIHVPEKDCNAILGQTLVGARGVVLNQELQRVMVQIEADSHKCGFAWKYADQ